ncbi:MAG TPA: GntR family transcriptional regulator [Acidimicrobiales bacterium]|jgi:DNA-binding GntR family transcriptional regulator|nr:GntR family transcriptional regulator [Acidimicrobiales bacterium]
MTSDRAEDRAVAGNGGMRVSATAAPVRSQVLRNLREAILNRTFVPGQRLIERELCELTGVSRTSVREALRQLESEGLVVLIPNQGPVVAKMTPEEAVDLYEVRALLEALAARRFAATATDEEIAELKATVDTFERTVRKGDLGEILQRKDDFYAVLLRGDRNPIVRSVLGSLHARIMYLRATSLRRKSRSSETIAELRELLDAIIARDADTAWALSKAHVEAAAAAALQVLAET